MPAHARSHERRAAVVVKRVWISATFEQQLGAVGVPRAACSKKGGLSAAVGDVSIRSFLKQQPYALNMPAVAREPKWGRQSPTAALEFQMWSAFRACVWLERAVGQAGSAALGLVIPATEIHTVIQLPFPAVV